MQTLLKELLYTADSIVKRCLCLYRAKALNDPVRTSLITVESAINNALTEIHLNIVD